MEPRSISFDRAADFYDATRGHSPQVSAQIAAAARRWLQAGEPVLEIGIGTGRIARPLMDLGVPITGLDLSVNMMQRLRQALPAGVRPPDLVQGDANYIPFPAHTFHAVIAVHVFHLIPTWQTVISEARRVLRSGGLLLAGYDWRPPDSPVSLLRRKWREIYQKLGEPGHTNAGREFDQLISRLKAMGAAAEEVIAAEWSMESTPEEYIRLLENRVYSSTWDIPADLHAQIIARLRRWAAVELGPLDQPFSLPRRFIWQAFRWEH